MIAWDWAAWGTAGERPVLDEQARGFLEHELGAGTPATAAAVESVRAEPSRLPEPARARLVAAVGPDHVLLDDVARLRRTGGQSYVDLVRRRGGALPTPDAVVRPADADQVGAVLRACSELGVAVVPLGGGTSVVGGLEPLRGAHPGVVVLDLARLDAVLDLDPVSRLVTAQAGMRGPALEAALAREGLTLGHFPQSYERASVGGFAVTRSAGQASTGYGRFDDLVAGLRLVTPVGELVLRPQPASAAGPDLRRLVLGSEGVLGVVTDLTLRASAAPSVRRYEGWVVPSFAAGQEVFRRLAQDGPVADVMRLSDETETRVALTLTGPRGLRRDAVDGYLRLRRRQGGCLVVMGFEGEAADVAHRRRAVAGRLRTAGAVSLGTAAGRSWEHGRFAWPHQRDALLDAGYLAETLETATTWSRLSALDAAVTDALESALAGLGTPALVGCHVSHVYPDGASLYFTVLARRRPGDEVAQWETAKRAAGEAIARTEGTATHHHGVGIAHLPWVAGDLSPLGVEVLRAVKATLDPAGVLNPGKLLPDPKR